MSDDEDEDMNFTKYRSLLNSVAGLKVHLVSSAEMDYIVMDRNAGVRVLSLSAGFITLPGAPRTETRNFPMTNATHVSVLGEPWLRRYNDESEESERDLERKYLQFRRELPVGHEVPPIPRLPTDQIYPVQIPTKRW